MEKEFRNYGVNHLGLPGTLIDDYMINGIHKPKGLTPMIVEEREMNVTLISVFDRLMKDRIIWLSSGIDDQVATVIQAQLMFLDSVDHDQDITLHINSPGGSVYAGLGVVDVMDYINSDIRTINTGMAASMGAVLLGGGTKGKRMSLKHSRTMLHHSSGGFGGNILDAKKDMEQWAKVNDDLFIILGDYCGKSAKQIKKDAERDNWLTASEAVKYGIIDEVITNKKD